MKPQSSLEHKLHTLLSTQKPPSVFQLQLWECERLELAHERRSAEYLAPDPLDNVKPLGHTHVSFQRHSLANHCHLVASVEGRLDAHKEARKRRDAKHHDMRDTEVPQHIVQVGGLKHTVRPYEVLRSHTVSQSNRPTQRRASISLTYVLDARAWEHNVVLCRRDPREDLSAKAALRDVEARVFVGAAAVPSVRCRTLDH